MSFNPTDRSPAGVHPLTVLLTLAGGDVGKPFLVFEVQIDGLGDALFEGDRGLPVQLGHDLAGVNRQ